MLFVCLFVGLRLYCVFDGNSSREEENGRERMTEINFAQGVFRGSNVSSRPSYLVLIASYSVAVPYVSHHIQLLLYVHIHIK